MPRLLGERIQLREYQADDLEAIRQWVNDEATTRLPFHGLLAASDPGGYGRISAADASEQPQLL